MAALKLNFLITCLSVFFDFGHGFFARSGFSIQPSFSLSDVTFRVAENRDIPDTAKFLSEVMFGDNVSVGQQRELARLEQNDLSSRYGELVGTRKFPSVLLLAENSGKIVGCVGVDTQAYDSETLKFEKYSRGKDSSSIRLVLANLAVKPDERKKGVAKKLAINCETYAKEWGFDEIFLLVDERNTVARNFYKKIGYTDVFKDDTASCIVTGGPRLRTEPCTNICMKKNLASKSSASLFGNIFNIFKRS